MHIKLIHTHTSTLYILYTFTNNTHLFGKSAGFIVRPCFLNAGPELGALSIQLPGRISKNPPVAGPGILKEAHTWQHTVNGKLWVLSWDTVSGCCCELSHIQLQLQLVDLVAGLVEVLQLLLKVQGTHDIKITIQSWKVVLTHLVGVWAGMQAGEWPSQVPVCGRSRLVQVILSCLC